MRVSLLAIVLAAAGCPAPAGPTAQDGALHTGLVSGTTFTYSIGNGLSETHEVKDSGFLFGGGLAVDVLAKQNGFVQDERTLTFGIDIEQVSIVRLFDCIARCGTLDAPIPFLSWPLEEGQTTEGEAVVSVSEADGTSTLHRERHSTTVSGPKEVTVAAGTFDAFLISWSRTSTAPDGEETIESALLRLAPNVGVVQQDAFDGTALELELDP